MKIIQLNVLFAFFLNIYVACPSVHAFTIYALLLKRKRHTKQITRPFEGNKRTISQPTARNLTSFKILGQSLSSCQESLNQENKEFCKYYFYCYWIVSQYMLCHWKFYKWKSTLEEKVFHITSFLYF